MFLFLLLFICVFACFFMLIATKTLFSFTFHKFAFALALKLLWIVSFSFFFTAFKATIWDVFLFCFNSFNSLFVCTAKMIPERILKSWRNVAHASYEYIRVCMGVWVYMNVSVDIYFFLSFTLDLSLDRT